MANLKLNLFLFSSLLLAGSSHHQLISKKLNHSDDFNSLKKQEPAKEGTSKPKRLNYNNGFNYLKNMRRLLKENEDLKKEMKQLKRTGLQEIEELKIKFELMNRSMEFQLRAYDLQSSKIKEIQKKDLTIDRDFSHTDFINRIITNKEFLSAIEELIAEGLWTSWDGSRHLKPS